MRQSFLGIGATVLVLSSLVLIGCGGSTRAESLRGGEDGAVDGGSGEAGLDGAHHDGAFADGSLGENDSEVADASKKDSGEADGAGADASVDTSSSCGNGSCEQGETCGSCAKDCGVCMTESSLRIWHWNIAGHSIHGGSTTDGLIETIADSIVGGDADFATINEVCQVQMSALADALRARKWPVDESNFLRFAEARAANTGVCKNTAYGIALLSKQPLGKSQTIELPDSATLERRKLLCAPLRDRGHLRICTTHLTLSDKDQVAQFKEVLSTVKGYVEQNDTVVLTGDLNAEPDSTLLDAFYSSTANTVNNGNNSGFLRELDDTDEKCPGYGEMTIGGTGSPCEKGRKIDYIFVPQARVVGSYQADSHAIPTCGQEACSDHRMLDGVVKVKVP